MIKEGFDAMVEIYSLYFKNGWYLAVIAAVIIIILWMDKKKEARWLLITCGLIWILFLNPVVIGLICGMKGSETGRFVRIFWIFPFIPGIAYVVTKLMHKHKVYQRILILAGTAAILFLTGGTILSKVNFTKADNLYKLPAEVIEVADKIEENKKDEWEHPCVFTNYYLSIYLRQYDGNMYLVSGREPIGDNGYDLHWYAYNYAAEEIPYDQLYRVGELAWQNGVEMIVLAKYQVQSQALESIGYEKVDDTENYYIFRYEG